LLCCAAQVIISDVDVMWLRDPLPFFQKFPDADILTSTDHLTPTVGTAEELEKYPDAGSAFNIGGLSVVSRLHVDVWAAAAIACDCICNRSHLRIVNFSVGL
jgi:hypothetical protein